MAEIQENEAHNVPELTKNVNGKTYIFHIKINAKTYGYKIFSIHGIYPMDLENQYILQQIKQEKRGNNQMILKKKNAVRRKPTTMYVRIKRAQFRRRRIR